MSRPDSLAVLIRVYFIFVPKLASHFLFVVKNQISSSIYEEEVTKHVERGLIFAFVKGDSKNYTIQNTLCAQFFSPLVQKTQTFSLTTLADLPPTLAFDCSFTVSNPG